MVDESNVPKLSASDVARQLGMSRQGVRYMLQKGILRGHYYPSAHRGTWRISQAEVDAFLRRTRNVTEPTAPRELPAHK